MNQNPVASAASYEETFKFIIESKFSMPKENQKNILGPIPWRKVCNQIPCMIAVLDQKYRYRWVNTRYAMYTGKKVDELIGYNIFELFEEKKATNIKNRLDLAMLGRNQIHNVLDQTYDGGEHFLNIDFSILDDGNEKLILVTIRDITRLKEVEAFDHDQVNIKKKQMEAIKALLVTLNHHLNNHLTKGILKIAEIKKRQLKAEEHLDFLKETFYQIARELNYLGQLEEIELENYSEEIKMIKIKNGWKHK